jgi:signal transduction histidine kinase
MCPDVIVTELDLDGLSGPELLQRLKSSSPNSRLVVWSRLRDPSLIAGCLSLGVSGYLLKPDDEPEAVVQAATTAWTGASLSPAAADLIGNELGARVQQLNLLQEELAAAWRAVGERSSAKSEFLANISHELRTPVTVAKGIAHMLANTPVPEQERESFFSRLQTSLDRLGEIVDELITLADLERGSFAPQVTQTDLVPVVNHAIDQIMERYPDARIVADTGASLSVLADPYWIGAVVRELLDNACRFSAPGRSIEVTARSQEEGAVVIVTDRGEGLGRSAASTSFAEPFSVDESILHKERSGLGIGLHLARQLILEHGGVLWSDPLPAGGTRVGFCLPARPGERLQERPASSPIPQR